MAEAVFKDLIKKEQLSHLISVDSAGTGSWHIGERPHKGTLSILKEHGISSEGLVGRLLTPEDIKENDYIIAMDRSNIKNIEKLAPEGYSHKIHLLLDFATDCPEKDVPDPYYTGNFEQVFNLISDGTTALLNYIKQKEKLSV